MLPCQGSRRRDPSLLIVNCILGAMVLSVVGIFGFAFYHISSKPAPAVPAFADGQMVRMKAFGVTGMVIGTYCWRSGCSYDVRFPSLQIKIPNGGLLSNGGPVDFSPVSKIQVREFEIEAI